MPDFTMMWGTEYGSIMDKISQIFSNRAKSSEMRSHWKAFLVRMVKEKKLNVTKKMKFWVERTSGNRYVTFHKNQRSLASQDPVTNKPWIELAKVCDFTPLIIMWFQ